MLLGKLAVGLDMRLRPSFFCGDGWRRALSDNFLAEQSVLRFELISLVRDRGSFFGLGALSTGLLALGSGSACSSSAFVGGGESGAGVEL